MTATKPLRLRGATMAGLVVTVNIACTQSPTTQLFAVLETNLEIVVLRPDGRSLPGADVLLQVLAKGDTTVLVNSRRAPTDSTGVFRFHSFDPVGGWQNVRISITPPQNSSLASIVVRDSTEYRESAAVPRVLTITLPP